MKLRFNAHLQTVFTGRRSLEGADCLSLNRASAECRPFEFVNLTDTTQATEHRRE